MFIKAHLDNYFGATFLPTLACVGTLVFFYFLLLRTLYKNYPFQVIGFLILLTAFVCINAYFIDRLYIIKGADKESNIFYLTKSLEDTYSKIRIDRSSLYILHGETNSSFWAFDRSFTALFDNENIALKLSVFGRGNMKYCLIALFNYYKCKKLLIVVNSD